MVITISKLDLSDSLTRGEGGQTGGRMLLHVQLWYFFFLI